MPIGNLRLRNIFNPDVLKSIESLSAPQSMAPQEPQYVPQLPPFQVTQPAQQVQGAEPSGENWTDIFKQLYQPETANTDRMNALLGQMPQRGQPSWLNRIGGALAGIAHGPQAQEAAMYAPFNRAMGDWQTQFKPVEQAANLERQENVNRRALAQNIALREAGDKKETRLAGEKQQDLAIKQQRADAIDWAHKNPHLELIKQPGGNLMSRNPITNQTAPVLDGQGNPIPSNIMTDKQIIDLKFQGDVQLQDKWRSDKYGTSTTIT